MGAADRRAVRQPQRPVCRQPASSEPAGEAQLLPGPGQHVSGLLRTAVPPHQRRGPARHHERRPGRRRSRSHPARARRLLRGRVRPSLPARGLYLSATGTYGSGLTNGADPDATYGTGLLAFNKSIKVPSSFILNASAGYAFAVGGAVLRPQIYVENVFDKQYLLKGAFFS